ncbi:MAG TPA: hypothetical protein VNJ04_18870 [Gemmatimonadaceae bacterium]|nr:hypothetical protein [Gemmatimonadaceae bacterium]
MSELWHRRKELGEPVHCYHAFTHFRDMAAGARTVDGAYRIHMSECRKRRDADTLEAPGKWRAWKAAYWWQDRVDAFDAVIEEEARQKRLKDIIEMNERHAAVASALQGKVIARLQALQPSDLSVAQLIIWFREATIIERRARGEATDIVQHDGPGVVTDLSGLTDKELDKFEQLMVKAQQKRLDGVAP